MGGTDPSFDGATTDKRHLKHCAVIRWWTGVEFTPGRLAAVFQSDIDAIVLHNRVGSLRAAISLNDDQIDCGVGQAHLDVFLIFR
jgi:hypothetical protein